MKHNENSAENAAAPMEPRTLRDLGIDGALAAELESAFRLLGMTSGNRIVGWTFVTAAGAPHALCLDPTADEQASIRVQERAA